MDAYVRPNVILNDGFGRTRRPSYDHCFEISEQAKQHDANNSKKSPTADSRGTFLFAIGCSCTMGAVAQDPADPFGAGPAKPAPAKKKEAVDTSNERDPAVNSVLESKPKTPERANASGPIANGPEPDGPSGDVSGPDYRRETG